MAKEKTVLCFGDSNTWGSDPAGGPRFDRMTRWPGVLQSELGTGYYVIAEGLGGRTTVWDDPLEGPKNGLRQLLPLLKSHMPLDLLVIMLGTNDLKNRFSVSAMDVSRGVGQLVEVARQNPDVFADQKVEILVICPPPFASMDGMALQDIFIGAEEKSRQLAGAFQSFCAEKKIRLLNAGDIISSSPLDGIHLEASEHAVLGKAVAAAIKGIV